MGNRGWLLALCFGLACSSNSTPPPSPGTGPGGKSDGLGPDTAEISCNVVQVRDDNVLEEGLGSIYDIGREGWLESDGDSLGVSLRQSEFSEHESGFLVSIGQRTFGLHSADDTIEVLDEAPRFNNDPAFTSYRVRRDGSSTAFKIRFFHQTQLALVFHEDAEEGESCRDDALTQCEGACGESTETIDEEFECQAGCSIEVQDQCPMKHLAVADCRGLELPTDVLDF